MAPAPSYSSRIEEAQKLRKKDPSKAEAIYKDILSKAPGSGEAALREYETALMSLGELYRDTKRANDLADLVTKSKSALSSFAKAKTAKISMGRYSVSRAVADIVQFASSSISSLPYPTQPTYKSPLPSHASNGPSQNAAASCARTSKPAWCPSTCKSNPTTTP